MEPNSDTTKHKTAFDNKVLELLSKKKCNHQIWTKQAYDQMIQNLESAKIKRRKEPVDYIRLKKYDVAVVGGEKRIIVANSKELRIFVHTGEVFDILHKTHIENQHAGRNRMRDRLHKYKNITQEIITSFIKLCELCKTKPNGGTFVKRVVPASIRKSVIDFIDMPEGHAAYKFIFVHEDCDTKFVQLRPSKTKSAEETVSLVLDIFSIFGLSSSLLSHVGTEHCKEVISKLSEILPESNKIQAIDGAEDPYSLHDTIDAIMSIIRCEIGTAGVNWVDRLKFAQMKKNETFDDEIQQSPFLAMFLPDIVHLKRKKPTETVDEEENEALHKLPIVSSDGEKNSKNGKTSETPLLAEVDIKLEKEGSEDKDGEVEETEIKKAKFAETDHLSIKKEERELDSYMAEVEGEVSIQDSIKIEFNTPWGPEKFE